MRRECSEKSRRLESSAFEDGRRWRAEYLKITYAEGRYRALRSCEGA